jgi:tRNA(Ile)-lysidine synthase
MGVAVSGGSDSLALMLLLQQLERFDLKTVTVDHGLRPEAASEAAHTAAIARNLGLAHETLVWEGWDGAGNTQDAARRARYGLMADWARRNDIPAIALGHTLDDQAETLVMRLARGAGVDGLSAMSPSRAMDGVTWLRPMLGITRADLRIFLKSEGVSWIDDPSNDDTSYDRVRVRRATGVLADLGVTSEALARVARNMQSAREALEATSVEAAQSMANFRAGGVALDEEALSKLPDDIARRIIMAAVRWITGADYAPRGRALASAMTEVRENGSATLNGCRMLRKHGQVWVMREYERVKTQQTSADALWDGRWRIAGAARAGDYVAALGPQGLPQCPDWRETGLPRALLLSSPAIWRQGILCAAPLAGMPNGWSVCLEKGETSFFQHLISH